MFMISGEKRKEASLRRQALQGLTLRLYTKIKFKIESVASNVIIFK